MDVQEAIRMRRSVRSFSARPLSPELLERLRVALRSAPSACNFQPVHFIFVTEVAQRKKVGEQRSQVGARPGRDRPRVPVVAARLVPLDRLQPPLQPLQPDRGLGGLGRLDIQA